MVIPTLGKKGKHRIATFVVFMIIVFMALILAYAPDGDSITGGSIADNGITGGSVANQITGHAVFSFPSGLDTRSGMMGITGLAVEDDEDIEDGYDLDCEDESCFLAGVMDGDTTIDVGGQRALMITYSGGGASEYYTIPSDPDGKVYDADGNLIGAWENVDGQNVVTITPPDDPTEPTAPEGEAAAPGEEEDEEEEGEVVPGATSPGPTTEGDLPDALKDDKERLDGILTGMGLTDYEYTPSTTMGKGTLGNDQTRITDDGEVSVFIGGRWIHQGQGALLSGPMFYDENGRVVTLSFEERATFRNGATQIRNLRRDIAKHPDGRTYYERVQMNQQYQRTRIQFTGRLSGWLSGMISSGQLIPGIDATKVGPGLSDAANKVPGLICQNAYGLSYDQGNSWIRSVQPNATPWMAQAQLMENARIATIDGEKEEIIDHLFRYAYSLRLLGDTSVEWETYLKNSCTNVRSDDVEGGFYDWGHLGPGQHEYKHYAGSSGEDMIFNCEVEECIFDEACVQLADEPAPYCVPLVNGAGFRTVDTAAYGCWDPERTYDEFRDDING